LDIGTGLTGVSGLSDAHFEKFFVIYNHVLAFIPFLPRGIGVSVHKVIIVRKAMAKGFFFEYEPHSVSYKSP